LITSGRLEVQNYKPHDDRYLQPAGGGQLTPVESGQDHRLMQYGLGSYDNYRFSVRFINLTNVKRSTFEGFQMNKDL
jgi:hypothetical protein